MNKNYKRHIIIFFTSFFLMIFGTIITVIVVDPFFQYHKPIKGISYIIDNQLTQNPGIAKNFDYDSVILGSSMTVNFDTALFEETMGLNTVKLSYNGAYPKDICNIMELVVQSPNQLKEVFLGIDIYTYKAAPGITSYEMPYYLYDNTPLNDISYLLNKDVLLDYIIMPQVKHENTPINEIYWTWIYMVYSAQVTLSYYNIPTSYEEMLPVNTYQDNIAANMQNYILPYIEAMPDTQFTIFFPPYSILYWHSRYADGSLYAELAGERQIIEMLLSYPNVRIFYFQNQYDFITDLNNYCDYTHYSPEMNNQMMLGFSEENCPYEITTENYEDILNEMEAWLKEFDFENYLVL